MLIMELEIMTCVKMITNNKIMTNTEIISKLNVLLADYQIYYQNLRGFHWNIQGKLFFELHAKFEELYISFYIDVITVCILSTNYSFAYIHVFVNR